MSSNIVYQLIERGLVKECFPDNCPLDTSNIPCAYAGFDATSSSLHIGNLLVLMSLFHWQRAGNRAIIVIGDFTARLGDPSGNLKGRKALDKDFVNANAESIENSLHEIILNHEHQFLLKNPSRKRPLEPIKILRNSSWYEKLKIDDFFYSCDAVTLSDMLSRTSVKRRIESGIGLRPREFIYQLLQSYDWLHLFQAYNCKFQFGGSDQMGNIVSGYEVITGNHYQPVHGVLLPLIQSEEGDKYGKTAGNAIFLSEDQTSPFELYQFFKRLPDAEVGKFLKLFTFNALPEIENIVEKHMKHPDARSAQQKLAEEVTLLVHGETGLNSAKAATKVIYQSDAESLAKLSVKELKQILPESCVTKLPLEPGMSMLEMTMKAGCFLTEDDAVRIITGGGVYINLQRINSPKSVLVDGQHILPNGTTVIRIGKKNFYVVEWK